MSTVTASALIGGTRRYGGVRPTVLALFHEGSSSALWQLLPVVVAPPAGADQLALGEGRRLRSCSPGEAIDELRLALHLWFPGADSDVVRTAAGAAGVGPDADDVDLATVPHAVRGRLLALARTPIGWTVGLTVYDGSALTGHDLALVTVPGWDAEVHRCVGKQWFSDVDASWSRWISPVAED